MRNYNVKSMDGRIISYLFLLLIVIDFIQADPKLSYESKRWELNKKLNKRLQNYVIKHFSRKQDADSQNVNGSLPHPNVATNNKQNLNDDGDDNMNSGLDEDHNASELDNEPEAEENVNYDVEKDDSDALIDSGDVVKTRSLTVGDTFTTIEMLEVAKRLLSQVKKPGKGIVSSSKNPYELADKLFEGYFLTLKRIVILRDIDIDGLDALQALSLNGEVVDKLRTSTDSFTEAPIIKGFKADPNVIFYGIGSKDFPTRCHYKVLKKLVTDQPQAKNDSKKESKRRQAVKLQKKLGKNRKLVVNPGRRGVDKYNKDEEHGGKYARKPTSIKQMAAKSSKDKRVRDTGSHKIARAVKSKKLSTKSDNKKVFRTKTEQNSPEKNPTCRWKYNCTTTWNLNTCRLRSVCSNEKNYKYVLGREEDENLRRFHEMVGIDIIDEEVEKILQVHIFRLKPENIEPEKALESLAQYFNRIMYIDETTQKLGPGDGDDLSVTEDPGPLNEDVESNPQAENETSAQDTEQSNDEKTDLRDTADADDAEARRILGLSPIHQTVTTPIRNIL